MQRSFLEKFRRVTSSGFYLPQVDGLRFVAIFMVVCIAHIPNYINQKFFAGNFIRSAYWQQFSLNGVFGVQLFFIISGFVLGHYFAKKYINNKEKPDLKNYYLRRLTRIEPPYIIALVLFFIALVFILHKYSFAELWPHFLASVFYVHNSVYYQNSYVLPVAWTLEIEIQFYIVAPLLAMIYLIKSKQLRWLIFLALIIGDAAYWFNVWHGMNLLKYLHYFLVGMLVADLYVEKIKFPFNKNTGFAIGLISLLAMLFVLGYYDALGYIIKYLLMALSFYAVLTNERLAKLFSFTPVAIIGGMCYSIYLIHEQVISATGRLLKFINIENDVVTFILFYLILIIAILVTGGIYYKLVEQPCMKKYWWRGLFKVKKTA